MHPSEINKSKQGVQTMFDFANQFGTDIYAEILLNVLMEGLMNDETLFVSGKSEQTEGDQIGDGPPIAQNPKI